jgi:glycosyltransferase involved in cell wall biosynthesis
MNSPYLSVVIPAYNEAHRIVATLRDMNEKLSRAPYSYEIVVVNDGSKDETAEVVNGVVGEIKNLRLIDNAANKGKGGVVRQGMLEAMGKIRLFTDADNSTSIDQFEAMRPFFDEKGYDVVIGSRAIKGAHIAVPQPLYRQIPGKMGNLFIQLMVLPGIWDTQCGFKAFTEEAARKVFSMSRISGWGFDVEVLALAKRCGYRIAEVPVRWINDENSHVGASAYLKVLLETITIRWWLWTGKYKL